MNSGGLMGGLARHMFRSSERRTPPHVVTLAHHGRRYPQTF